MIPSGPLGRYLSLLKHHGSEGTADFDDLFVESSHYEDLRRRVLENRMFCITGPEGTGKSTCMRRIIRDLAAPYVYVDIKTIPENQRPRNLDEFKELLRARMMNEIGRRYSDLGLPEIVASLLRMHELDLPTYAAARGVSKAGLADLLEKDPSFYNEEQWDKLCKKVAPGIMMAVVRQRDSTPWYLFVDNGDALGHNLQREMVDYLDSIVSNARADGTPTGDSTMLKVVFALRRRNLRKRLGGHPVGTAEAPEFEVAQIICEKCQSRPIVDQKCDCGHSHPGSMVGLAIMMADASDPGPVYREFVLRRLKVFTDHERARVSWPGRKHLNDPATDRDLQNIEDLQNLVFRAFESERVPDLCNHSAREVLDGVAEFLEFSNSNTQFPLQGLLSSFRIANRQMSPEVNQNLISLVYRWIASRSSSEISHHMEPEHAFPDEGCSIHLLLLSVLIHGGRSNPLDADHERRSRQPKRDSYSWIGVDELFRKLGDIGYSNGQVREALKHLFRGHGNATAAHLVDLRLQCDETLAGEDLKIEATDAASVTLRGVEFARRTLYKFHYLDALEANGTTVPAPDRVGRKIARLSKTHARAFVGLARSRRRQSASADEFLDWYKSRFALRIQGAETPLQVDRMILNAVAFLGGSINDRGEVTAPPEGHRFSTEIRRLGRIKKNYRNAILDAIDWGLADSEPPAGFPGGLDWGGMD